MKNSLLSAIAVIGLGVGLVACHQGPTASAGESVDHAASQATNAVRNATGVSGPAEKAGQKVDNAAYNATH
ncbi:MAG: hypothetical protein K0S29_880 [Gammaproteobacteria bacterium]|jgi:hypothetical protein|nr:hypothetical protein [Gammaproteobacteria bacterium]